MNPKDKNDRRWVLEAARRVADELRTQRAGTSLRLRIPEKSHSSDTDGWAVVIGSLGKGRPGLEIWLDRFTGHQNRKLYAAFFSRNEQAIRKLAFRSKALWPVRELADVDLADTGAAKMKEKLRKGEFNRPVLENYRDQGYHFFGIYGVTAGSAEKAAKSFCQSAVAFFLDVANSLPASKSQIAKRQLDSQNEPKKWVKAHLRRERSRYLALECKRRDQYECQVCKMTFSAVYGKELGEGFAEAHHVKPLAGAPKNAKTKLVDLITVCSNCHRMLHRMENIPSDVKRLRTLIGNCRK
jgi:5-methylcytosine-specific restriction endonuclease McrA